MSAADELLDKNNPVVAYAEMHLWGNPEENHQYQVKINRISDEYGITMNFSYMGKFRTLPKRDTFFHVFTVGGLHPGYWNFKNTVLNRNPLDRWVNVGALCKARGLQLDVYNSKGFIYSRSDIYLMVTYDGLTLLAFKKNRGYPIPTREEMFFRCYTPSIPVAFGPLAEDPNNNPFIFETMTYESEQELATFTARYSYLKGKPGWTATFHNGVYFEGAPNALPNLLVSDLVEIWHDPTVIRVERYRYADLQDFYSELDSKRKLIIHPPKVEDDFSLRYFDDNDYYLVGTGQKGLYLNRNSVTTVRQLTHQDVSIADDFLQGMSNHIPELSNILDTTILVLVRKTDWEFQWPEEHNHIRYLYRMDDQGIVKAMTGDRATLSEWTANGLEMSSVMSLVRSQYGAFNRKNASLALGYNALTRVLSETPVKSEYIPGGRGVLIPVTYRGDFSAWEYDADGQLLGWYLSRESLYFTPNHPECVMVEFVLGRAGRKLDSVVTNEDVTVDPYFDVRVYVQAYSVKYSVLTGEMRDVTGDDSIYLIKDGKIHWVGLDKVNERGIIFTNKRHLAYSFQLDHMDHSLAFAVTHIYEPGGLLFPFAFAQTDVWLNGHPLIDNVDWIYRDGYCYIINKEFIVEGPQTITFRAHGFSPDMENPKFETELGFVEGGVIGRFGRYNLREDRVTRTVIGGALYITDDVPTAEMNTSGDLWDELNGRPYMVKHVYCPIKFVEPYNNFPLYDRSRAVDQKVSDYLTQWLPKPGMGEGSAIPNLQDKYRLFSPFMNVIANGVVNGFIQIPATDGGSPIYSEQVLRDLVKDYLWWLKVDPIQLNFDRRYFAVMPFANTGQLTVTANEFIFLKQINDSYLDSACALEGHFLINNFIR